MFQNERKKRKPYHLLSKAGKRYRHCLENRDDEINNTDATNELQFIEPGPSTVTQLEYTSVVRSESSSTEVLDGMYINISDDAIHSDESFDTDFRHQPFSDISSDESFTVISGHETDEDTDLVPCVQDQTGSVTLSNVKQVELFLKSWAIKQNIPLSSLSSLCAGLKEHHPTCFSSLHTDARTILKTPMNLNVIDVPPGQYIHIGLEKQLLLIVGSLKSSKLQHDELQLLFNIDGLPIFHSSSGELYPILFTIPTVLELKNKVYPVGLYYGEKKPEDISSFLHSFLDELLRLLENGLDVEGEKIRISILGFCCDTPAKSFLLGITSHTGYSSCTRCTIYGLTVENRRVFHDVNCEKRTHENFLNRTDKIFQPRTTPLTNVPGLHFCSSFVLDYMHLICLGVMRTLMTLWCNGPLPLRLSRTQRTLMSEKLLSLRNEIPVEFARKPRETTHIKSWKATEWRMFLLYFGPIVLKDLLSIEKFNHFLCLHIATTILLTPKKCSESTLLDYSKKLLANFVLDMRVLYGDMYVSHNFHNLIHITDDVDFFSYSIPNFSLDSISAFPFENFLQTLKRKVRGHNKPLQQIGKRLGEEFSTYSNTQLTNRSKEMIFTKKQFGGPLPAFCSDPQYKKVKFTLKGIELSTEHPNNCCRLKNGAILLIENMVYSNEMKEQVVVGKKFLKMENIYTEHLYSSGELGICKVSHMSNRKFWPVKNIEAKCMLINLGDKKFVFPLLHSETTN